MRTPARNSLTPPCSQQTGGPTGDLAQREALFRRIGMKRRRALEPTLPILPAVDPSGSAPDAQTLIGLAHRVLVRYRPGAVLPAELKKVRALLDPHMFGRDSRTHRDDAVSIARQMDRLEST